MSFEHYKLKSEYFARFLDTIGDGTGIFQANVNGSVTPVEFKVDVPVDKVLFIQELVVTVRDNGQFAAGGYGALPTLTNGIKIYYKPDAVTPPIDRTPQKAIDCNGCWAIIASRYEQRLTTTNDQAHSSIHWFHTPLEIRGGGWYKIIVRDDLTGLTAHTFRIHGALSYPIDAIKG